MIRLSKISILLLMSTALAFSANAQVVRSISGTAQFAIGNGLPIPNLVVGGVPATASANVTMPGASAGASTITGLTITIPPSQFQHNIGATMGFNTPVLMYNSMVFQVYTNLSVAFPNAAAPAQVPNGRTGPDIVTWCPGHTTTVTMGTNPTCLGPGNHPNVTIMTCNKLSCPGPLSAQYNINGLVTYNRTAGALGGPGGGQLGGTFNVALKLGTMTAAFLGGVPASTAGVGGAFGHYIQNFPGPPGPVHINIMYTPNGAITNPGTMAPGALTNNTTASFGVPFTAGPLYLLVSQTVGGGTEMFNLSGYDARNTMTGGGNVQLVGGAVSTRTTSGNNANRGTVSFTVAPEPASIAGAAGALIVLAGAHFAARRRNK